MMGYGMYGDLVGFFVEILIILLIVGVVVMLLNRSNFVGSGNNERLMKVEKDVEEIKKAVEEIRNKLNEI
ncbi:hypothetical protein [Methanomethylovorans sp.]|uniref:hypothetical protein n=1 Tax=Methanomethylovorans sp. TaxID=2758717 RepID=UPI00351CB689